ncbi:MAG: hypothetical protein ACW99G_02575 [Candidatus Thorarchaeota archaeon]|jgi:hypothetical protein
MDMKAADVKKRALIDLIGSLPVALPLAAGLTSFMASWVNDGSPLMTVLGVAGILGAGAMYVTSLLFWQGDMIEKAQEKIVKEEEDVLNEELKKLRTKLLRTPETQDEDMLLELRNIYDDFKNDKTGSLVTAYDMSQIVEEMFHACIHQLEASYEKYKQRNKTKNEELRRKIEIERAVMLTEVDETIVQIRKTVSELHTLDVNDSSVNLGQLSDRLTRQLEIAKEVESRMNNSNMDIEQLEQELNEFQRE